MLRRQANRLLFLVPKDWDDEVVAKAIEAVPVPVGWTMVSSLVDFVRRADIEGGFLGWPKMAASRYDGAVSPVVAVGRANATIVEIMLAQQKPVYINKTTGLERVESVQWTGTWRALLLTSCQDTLPDALTSGKADPTV